MGSILATLSVILYAAVVAVNKICYLAIKVIL